MMILTSLLLSLPAFAVAPAPAPQGGPSVKDLFDMELAPMRRAQGADGSYGGRVDTAFVVTAMALSPRAYREEDGPFVRDAVIWLIRQTEAEGDPAADLATALALQCVDAARYTERIAGLAQRGGVSADAIRRLATLGAWDGPAAEGLPLPGEQDAAAILGGLPEYAGFSMRAEAAARAGLALKRASAASPAALPTGASYERGVDFLLGARGASGVWEVFGQPEPGISALAARALLGSSREEARAAALPVLDYLKGLQKEDGSIYQRGLPVYVTSVAIMAFAAGGREEDREAIARGANFLRSTQVDAGEGYSEADKYYGGIGYGGDLRPDLSNLQYALQALHDSGAAADDEAFQKALVFLQRTQNRSEGNPETYKRVGTDEPVRAGNDGGAAYMPGDSPAGYVEMPDGTLVARSYGSMTYAMLKCYVFAGLPADDPRVEAAVGWLQRHWTLEVNPGFDVLRDPRGGFQGLYYYYLSLAEALRAAGIDEVVGADGAQHDWRLELAAKLVAEQKADGSWVNEMADRWWEGNPVLCTAYALAALHTTRS
jgi:squalene-hopene/tetraprenyl-beta-curcumene cyclase